MENYGEKQAKNLFKKTSEQLHDIYLNSPRHKFGIYVKHINQRLGLGIHTRLRFVDSFDMYGPFIGTRVKSYAIIDLNLKFGLPHNSHLALTIQNLLDNKHIEFIGAPRIGRLSILRISYSI